MEVHEERVERFRLLYDAAYPRVLAYALRRARTREDALEVLSETMLIAWRRLDDIPEGERRLPWMFGVARRVLANQYRAADRRERLTGSLVPRPDREPEFDLVHEALESLRPADREILTLAAWEDLENREIAAALGIAPGTAALRLHRARRRLARELGRRGLTGPRTAKSDDSFRTLDQVEGILEPEEKERA